VIAFSLAALGASAGAGEAGHAPHWTYHGAEGPAHWGELAPEFATCKAGREQSPVDIVAGAPSAQSALGFAYTPQALQITNNGHTIQVDRAQGGTLSVGDARYALAQFHFHGPSEHTVTGKHYPLELHLVHKASDGTLAVVGVLIEQGAANPALAPIVAHLPNKEGQSASVAAVAFDAATLLPAQHAYAHYRGSLTTPPCSEGVQWFVLDAPITASKAQIEALSRVMGANDRPVQPLNERAIEFSK
jgi:Carbonic anhydrase